MWLHHNFPASLYLDLLQTDLYLDLFSRPERLESLIPAGYQDWVIIDEVQRVPALLSEVHRLIESKGYKFILTGSSARSLRRKGTNLLGGRALIYRMHPLTCQELGTDFSLAKSLQYGNLPSVFSEPDPKRYLDAYIESYIREEVIHEGITRNLAGFSRFLETASFSQGSVVNASEIGREAFLSRKVVENYFDVLEDLLLAQRLPVFAKRAKRRLVAHPKFYYFDVGIYRALRPMGPLDSPAEAEGAALETLFFQELLAINDYLNLGYDLFYWRTSNGVEVDFVLYGSRGLIACEIKRSDRISSSDLSGLSSFGKDYPSATLYMFYGGSRYEQRDSIQLIPIEEGLRTLPALLKVN